MVREKEYIVSNGYGRSLKFIPYIGCKAGFKDIFDEVIPDISSDIYDIFGGGGSFSFYACQRFGSHRVNYNDNNPVIVNLIKCLQADPVGIYDTYCEHYHKSSDNHYYKVRESNIENGIEGAGNFLYLAKNAFSSKIRFNSKNRFNSPMRKGSSCPKLNVDSLIELSMTIEHMSITNLDYRHFSEVKNSLLYLDPPYMNNSNCHYNSVPDLSDFNRFLRQVEPHNRILFSEQNNPEIFELPDSYTVSSVTLNRSLQYVTQSDSKEIIAFNF